MIRLLNLRVFLSFFVLEVMLFLLFVHKADALNFTHGVASGDVTPFSAILWTRVDEEARVIAEVSRVPFFPRFKTLRRRAIASKRNDFTVKVHIAPLRPHTKYYFRWKKGTTISDIGYFKTAPAPLKSKEVLFAFSGDSDGTLVNINPLIGFHNNFEVFNRIIEEESDFFIYNGDTIYPDSTARTEFLNLPPASSLEEYRELYKINRSIAQPGYPPGIQSLMKSTSTYAIWDDHEVINDFDGETVEPQLYAIGRKAFVEYMPIDKRRLPFDLTCVGRPFFRVFNWGKDIQIIILDNRSCRSADVEEICQGDIVPTLPPEIRKQLAQQLQFPFPENPPDGCLEAINDPERTFLGSVQKILLKKALLMPAKYKFVINGPPIQQLYILPYDRWEGYAAERTEILEFIRKHQIENVIFLTTDAHTNLINEVFIDAFIDPQPIAQEFVTGPIAEFTFEEGILFFAINANLDPQILLGGFRFILDTIVHVNCRNLGGIRSQLGGQGALFTYGVVKYDPWTETATITGKDSDGNIVQNLGQDGGICELVIGP